jgi:hypothetical protein
VVVIPCLIMCRCKHKGGVVRAKPGNQEIARFCKVGSFWSREEQVSSPIFVSPKRVAPSPRVAGLRAPPQWPCSSSSQVLPTSAAAAPRLSVAAVGGAAGPGAARQGPGAEAHPSGNHTSSTLSKLLSYTAQGASFGSWTMSESSTFSRSATS